MKKIILSALILLSFVALVFLPYRAWLEKRLEIILERKGFENVELTIASLGLNSATLENISIGGENKINLKNITLEYSPRELWNGYLRDLSIAGATIDMQKNNDGRWVITGLEGLSNQSQSNDPIAVPITPEQLAFIPFDSIKIEDSILNVSLDKTRLSLPLDLTWEKTPKSQLAYKGDDLTFRLNNLEITTGNLTLDAYISEGNTEWAGSWILKDIIVSGTAIPIPVMNGQGRASADQTQAAIKGHIQSNDKLWQAEFSMNYNLAVSEKSDLTILHAGMPWKEGRIDVRNIKIPLESQNPVNMILEIKSVSIQELMQSLTGDRISATGKVSGTLPLIIDRTGNFTVLPGNLKSEGAGTISMPPDSIPGNNEQVALVRQILEDLQYTGLSIAIKNDESGRLGILLTFEGNNPNVYEGRAVKLNVNLTGDVLEFIQQNILLMTSPEQLLKHGNNEKD